MSKINMEELTPWIGRSVQRHDVIRLEQAHLMAATLGVSNVSLTSGSVLPPLWHWLYFLEGLPPDQLGSDSHPIRGGFLPPVPLKNRMWAGGRLTFHEDLPIGAPVEKKSTIESVEHKSGRSGELVFVAVKHEIYHRGLLAISEIHDIVYKEKLDKNNVKTKIVQGFTSLPSVAPFSLHSKEFTPDSTTLFRYSALTFNGHKIHYDVDYCRSVEGYDNLVIHGPLNATLLANFAQDVTGKRLAHFTYRGIRPAILGQKLTLHTNYESNVDLNIDKRCEIKANELDFPLWMALENGDTSMQARAIFKS